MQSKTSCFNGAVYRKTLSRYWPLWAGAALILFFSMPYLIARIDSSMIYGGMPAAAVVATIALEATNSLPVFTCLFGLVFAAATFDYLFTNRAAGLMASLPIRREGLFCSSFLAGLTMLLSAGLLSAALAALLALTKGVHDLGAVWTWLGAYAAESVTFYAVGVFCAMLTGHILVLVPLYALVNFGGVVLSGMLQYMARLLLIGVPADGTLAAFSWLEKLSPCEQLLVNTGMNYNAVPPDPVLYFRGWPVVLTYLAAGVVLAALALVLFKRRSMECAQEPVTAKWLGQLLKYIVTFYCALGLPAFLAVFFGGGWTTSAVGLVCFVVLGAVIGYLISEMILMKSVRVKKKSWLGVAVTALVACLIVGAMQLDVFGYVHNVPDPAEIERAEVNAWYQLQAEITDADTLAALTDLHRNLIDEQEPGFYGSGDVRLTYHLKNGKTLTRSYTVRDDSSADCSAGRLRALLSRSDVFDASLEPWHDMTAQALVEVEISWNTPMPDDTDDYTGQYTSFFLDDRAAMDLWQNAILPDRSAGAFPSTMLSTVEHAYPSHLAITFTLRWEDRGTQMLYYVLTPDTTHTLAWLAAHGYEIPGIE